MAHPLKPLQKPEIKAPLTHPSTAHQLGTLQNRTRHESVQNLELLGTTVHLLHKAIIL